jgi:hypothetical protein
MNSSHRTQTRFPFGLVFFLILVGIVFSPFTAHAAQASAEPPLTAEERIMQQFDDDQVIECPNTVFQGHSRVWAGFNENSSTLSLYGQKKDTFLRLAQSALLELDFAGAVVNFTGSQGEIFITRKWPYRAATVEVAVKVAPRRLIPGKPLSSDSSADSIDQSLTFVLAGERKKAVEALGGVTYPMNYYSADLARDFLLKANREAHKRSREKSPQRAADILLAALDVIANMSMDCFRADDNQIDISDMPAPEKWLQAWKSLDLPDTALVEPLNNLAFFLQEAGDHTQAIPLLRAVLVKAPQRPVAFLNLADSLFAASKTAEAADWYAKYRDALTQAKKAGKIPARVTERLARLKGS